MRKVLFTAALAAAAVVALSAVPVAGAWSNCHSSCSSNGPVVVVEPNADLTAVLFVMVVLDVRCNALDAKGLVSFKLDQRGADSASGMDGHGEAINQPVNCDGAWHRLDVSTFCFMPMNLGPASLTLGELVEASTSKPLASFGGWVQVSS